jgi:hypothetical protein
LTKNRADPHGNHLDKPRTIQIQPDPAQKTPQSQKHVCPQIDPDRLCIPRVG